MLNLCECLERFSAHPLRRRIRRNEIRELRFKIDKFPVEPVVFAVADNGRGFLVAQVVGLWNLFSQLTDALCSFLLLHCHSARYKRVKTQQWQLTARVPAISLQIRGKTVNRTKLCVSEFSAWKAAAPKPPGRWWNATEMNCALSIKENCRHLTCA